MSASILYKPIRELATLKPAICLGPETSVRDAIQRMQDQGVGCVLVEQGGALAGIFTERDVLTKIIGMPVDLDAEPVRTFMTPGPEALSPDDLVQYALNKMTVGGFRHIPLVDDTERPVGVVSMRNVVDYMVELYRTEILNLPDSPRHIVRGREGA